MGSSLKTHQIHKAVPIATPKVARQIHPCVMYFILTVPTGSAQVRGSCWPWLAPLSRQLLFGRL